MSRELNRKQKQIILSEIQHNKVLGLENPYQISTNTYFKCMEINDHETFHQNVEHFIDDIKYSDDDDFFLGQWQSVKYENWLKEKGLHNSNAVIRGEQIEKMS
jgi:hypothetical protein